MASLKQFVRNVRAAKTIADERAVIQKESAAIRASFREESHDHNVRRNNVAKLLYLFTLGERTHFGQIECLKLLASPRFADKRLGHLATSLLLDENQEVLTLVTNSLKNDLSHSNQYVVGLALCTLGNIASVEMSRDLFAEIENLVSTSNPYIRRKAALCAMRICRKVPDLQEHFIEKAAHLLSDRNHGVLLCGLTLVTSLCEATEEDEEDGTEDIVAKFRQFVPALVRTLKGLASSGYAPEHDVTGITDPFLQVKVLHLLRVLARGDAQTSEQINDILAQVATNTDSSKNVGNSILYEAVRTILDIEADSGLRVLGVNILGKFLANRDNNIRYVALNTLIKVVAIEPNAVQRHRNTILDCLRDPDISIRRRALDLSFTLINESNVRVLIRELLAFLEVADNEFKPTMTSQIGIAADKFAPNKRWHVDTMLRVLFLAGNYVKEPILSSFIRLIATTPELQTYAVQKLYASLKKDLTQESLTQAAAWSIGEYGDALLRGGQYEEEEVVQQVKEEDVVDLFSTILNSSYATQVTTEYIETALIKLTTRLSDPAQIERVRRILLANQTNLDVEVQQRAVEYGNLFRYDDIRRGVVERMPPPQIQESSRVLGEAVSHKKAGKAAHRKSRIVKPTEQDLLLDLMGDTAPSAPSPTNGAHSNSNNNADLLADILSGGSGGIASAGSPAASTSPAPPPQQSNVAAIMDLFGSPSPSGAAAAGGSAAAAPGALPADLFSSPSTASPPPPPPPSAAAPAGFPCYNGNGLDVTIATQRNAEGAVQATARFRNVGGATISNVGLQAAVPKSQKLQLLAISSAEISPGQEATQLMRVVGLKGPLRLRLRIAYTHPSAGQVMEQVN
ncbi:ap-1 complex subunit gamma-1 [Niveomyces insectorum RCEF 264]|uniref:AP-1 complex subunit gamma n=1 Tax=Niveomyces insectorum RCEF 264 TaxID=1081102 RepID=A0A167X6P1_9HYPO|nr:ap-1 complex subunit gamma-1 [Niveomyces insectorum RCEF 264]